jgi:hypothetical protein
MTEANYMGTEPPGKPSISKRVWRRISVLRPGGRRNYRKKDTPFGVDPHPRRYHNAERRKRRKQVKKLMHRGEWPGRKGSA